MGKGVLLRGDPIGDLDLEEQRSFSIHALLLLAFQRLVSLVVAGKKMRIIAKCFEIVKHEL